jgi:hypothetical protein
MYSTSASGITPAASRLYALLACEISESLPPEFYDAPSAAAAAVYRRFNGHSPQGLQLIRIVQQAEI